MSTISLRIPESLHHAARELSKKERISINQFVTLALAEKISALGVKDYLEDRAARGKKKRFEDAMSKVPDLPPAEGDEF